MAYVLLFALAVCGGDPRVRPEPSLAETQPRTMRVYPATFVSCYDGDTCDFRVHLGLAVTVRQTVRFYGIDTPELRGSERAAAIEARDFVIQTLAGARDIALHVPQRRQCVHGQRECDERGRYGRLLANVLADEASLNALLLQTGRAHVY